MTIPQSVERVLAGLHGVRKNGAGWTALCPAHDDTNPSLSIDAGDNGGVVIHCHAGCSPEDVVSTLGLEMADLAPESASLPPERREAASYAYTDEDGNLLFESVRFEPKAFRFRRPAGRGGHDWSLGDTRRVLYRLPAVIEAAALGKTLYVVEGEKDVHAIENAGGVATCNPSGAGKWRDEYSESLRDADVVVVADKDEPGRKHAQKVAASLQDIAAAVRVVEPSDGKDAADHLAAGHSLDDFVEADPPKQDGAGKSAGKPIQAQILLELASDFDLWHSADCIGFATITRNGHREHHRIKSRSIRLRLIQLFCDQKGKPPHSAALASALGALEAWAVLRYPQRNAYVRVGEHDEAIYIDLGDEKWRAVRITPEGWTIEVQPEARFIRKPGTLPLPDPIPGGSIDELRPFVNVASDDDFRLLVGWLVAALRPQGPFPIEILQGEQGSAKSTTQRVQRSLIDPSTAPLRSPPRDERDLVIAATNGWVLAIDNASGIRDWLSDALCRLSTGGGWATRELYTDTDEILFEGQRPLLLNGIGDLATRDDLRDRALILSLPQIPDHCRRSEREFWADFEEAHPRILGALLDAVSVAMWREPSVELPSVPRMADFATWLTAAEGGLGWSPYSFLMAYEGNRRDAVEISMEFNVIASAISDLIADKGPWEGTAAELLQTLDERARESDRGRRRDWPDGPRAMSNALNRAAATLRRVGIEIDRLPRKAKRRVIVIREAGPDSVTTVTNVTDRDEHPRQAHQTELMLTDPPSPCDAAASLQSDVRHTNPRAGPVR